jgi:hypothetical protein
MRIEMNAPAAATSIVTVALLAIVGISLGGCHEMETTAREREHTRQEAMKAGLSETIVTTHYDRYSGTAWTK